VLTNTYPDGQLFAQGSALQPGSDFWFREGIVTTPEPSTLTLIGFSGLFVFIFKRRSKLVALLLFAAPVLPVYSAPDSVVRVTADAAGLTPFPLLFEKLNDLFAFGVAGFGRRHLAIWSVRKAFDGVTSQLLPF
jgi:hypothetical protein